jgi:addiction module HigA family antidote
MHNPPHPGEVLRDTILRQGEGALSVTGFAKRLGVSRVALSRVVNGRAAVSAELAIRLAAALGGSAESWLRMQVAYDLWQAQKKSRPKIRPLELRHAASRGARRIAKPSRPTTSTSRGTARFRTTQVIIPLSRAPELAGIARSGLGVPVGSLAGQRDTILAATDFLLTGF